MTGYLNKHTNSLEMSLILALCCSNLHTTYIVLYRPWRLVTYQAVVIRPQNVWKKRDIVLPTTKETLTSTSCGKHKQRGRKERERETFLEGRKITDGFIQYNTQTLGLFTDAETRHHSSTLIANTCLRLAHLQGEHKFGRELRAPINHGRSAAVSVSWQGSQ